MAQGFQSRPGVKADALSVWWSSRNNCFCSMGGKLNWGEAIWAGCEIGVCQAEIRRKENQVEGRVHARQGFWRAQEVPHTYSPGWVGEIKLDGSHWPRQVMKGSQGKRTELDSAGRGEPREVLRQGYARSDWKGEWKGGRTELQN